MTELRVNNGHIQDFSKDLNSFHISQPLTVSALGQSSHSEFSSEFPNVIDATAPTEVWKIWNISRDASSSTSDSSLTFILKWSHQLHNLHMRLRHIWNPSWNSYRLCQEDFELKGIRHPANILVSCCHYTSETPTSGSQTETPQMNPWTFLTLYSVFCLFFHCSQHLLPLDTDLDGCYHGNDSCSECIWISCPVKTTAHKS